MLNTAHRNFVSVDIAKGASKATFESGINKRSDHVLKLTIDPIQVIYIPSDLGKITSVELLKKNNKQSGQFVKFSEN